MIERLCMEKLNNTRDLGGMPTKDGRHILPNKLLRSGELHQATPGDLEILRDHQLVEIIDLRTGEERAERPDPVIPGVQNLHLPILKDAACGISHEEETRRQLEQDLFNGRLNDLQAALEYTEDMYRQMITEDFSLQQFSYFLEQFVQPKSGATLWHCAAGKDRAGVAALLLFECLGVERALILEDYLLTDLYMQENIQQELDFLQAGKSTEELQDLKRIFSCLYGAKREYIDIVYQTIERQYGDVPRFLKEALNIDSEKTNAIRKNCLT